MNYEDKLKIKKDFIQNIMSGMTKAKACRMEGSVSLTTINNLMIEDEEFRDAYYKACELGADDALDKVEEIGRLAMDMEIDPHSANAAIRAYSYVNEKRNQKRYGSKVTQTVTHEIDILDTLDRARQRVIEHNDTKQLTSSSEGTDS